MDKMSKEPSSKFIKVRCPKCKNEQIIFGKSASEIKCLVCEKVIAEPTGGKTRIKARVLEVLE
jgi:small subunit ribosomal protein S27e